MNVLYVICSITAQETQQQGFILLIHQKFYALKEKYFNVSCSLEQSNSFICHFQNWQGNSVKGYKNDRAENLAKTVTEDGTNIQLHEDNLLRWKQCDYC